MLLDLGDERTLAALSAHEGARHFDVGRRAHERERDIVHALGQSEREILVILRGQDRRAHAAGGQVDALVAAQAAAQDHAAMDVGTGHLFHAQFQRAVGQQQGVAGAHVAGQFPIGQAHFPGAAGDIAGGQDEFVAGVQFDAAAGKGPGPDLGPGQILQNGDRQPFPGGQFPYQGNLGGMRFARAV